MSDGDLPDCPDGCGPLAEPSDEVGYEMPYCPECGYLVYTTSGREGADPMPGSYYGQRREFRLSVLDLKDSIRKLLGLSVPEEYPRRETDD